MSYFPAIKVLNVGGAIINPAKEDGNLATLAGKDFATSAKQDTIIGHIDGIEGALSTLNAKDFATSAKQDTIIGYVDGIEGQLTTLNAKDFATSAKQDTIIGHIDGIEGQLTTIDTTLTDDSQTSQFVDPNGARLYLESNGAVPVNIQDQTSEMVTLYFREVLNTVTLAATITLGSRTCTLVAGHGVVVGDYLFFKQGTRFFQAEVTVVNVDTITVDSPFEYAFTAAAIGQRCNVNMNVDGSITPRTFYISPVGLTNVKVDITHISLAMRDNAEMDNSSFGGLAKLTNGCVLWVKDGTYKKLFNFKTNGDIGLYTQNLQYDPKAPSGEYGLLACKNYAGQANMGVTIRLDSATSDELQLIVQDNLTGLTRFVILAEGHVITN